MAAPAVAGAMLSFRLLFERTRKKMPKAIRAMAATPPTTPPTIGPIGVEDFEDSVGTGGLVAFGPRPSAGLLLLGVEVVVWGEVGDFPEDEDVVEMMVAIILSLPVATPQPRRVYPENSPE